MVGNQPLGSERDRPLYFAGRRDELAKLSDRLAFLKRSGDPSGGMTLIDGVQGIGKTQLMMEFVRRERERDSGVLHLPLTTRGLPADPAELFTLFTESLPKPATSKTNAIAALARNLKRIPVGIGTVELRERHRLLDNLLRDSHAEEWWRGRTLILTVDEVQSIDAEGRSTLRILHEGSHGCPILVVAAGLQHARASLAEPKTTRDGIVRDDAISRFALVLSLGMLRHAEVVEAVVKGVEASGEGTIANVLAERIATASMGFPQHVHGYVDAVIRVLRSHGELGSERAEQEVLRIGGERRRRFYELRLTSLAPRHQQAVVQVAAAMEDRRGSAAIGWDEAAAVIQKTVSGVDAATVIESAVQKGIWSASPTGVLTFPIPSFHDYLLRLLEDGDGAPDWH